MSEYTSNATDQPESSGNYAIFDDTGVMLPDISAALLQYFRDMPHAARISNMREARIYAGDDDALAAKIGQSVLLADFIDFTVPDTIEC